MANTTSAPIEIPKEEIGKLKFGENDILVAKEEKFQRKIDLERASALGASAKQNIKIYFVDANNVRYKVVATVWATTESNISLKGEALIPIKSIYKVGFF